MDIKKVGIYECIRNGSNKIREIELLDANDLDDYPNAELIIHNIIDKLRKKGFRDQTKNARVHHFPDGSGEAKDVIKKLDGILEEEEFSSYFKDLSYKYLNEPHAQEGVLVFVYHQDAAESRLAICQVPFLDDVYETDAKEVFAELQDDIIQNELKKGLLYVNPDLDDDSYEKGDIKNQEVRIYQRSESGYWYGFLELKEAKTADEEMMEHLIKSVEKPSIDFELSDISQPDDFDDAPDVVDEWEDAKVRIKIQDDIELNVKLKHILNRDVIRLLEKNGQYFVTFKSNDKPSIEKYDREENRWIDIFQNLDDFESPNNVF